MYFDMVRKLTWKNAAPNDEAFHLTGVPYDGRKKYGLHTHEFAEFFFVESGSLRHLVNGRESIVNEKEMVFIRPFDIHQFEALPDRQFMYFNISFRKEVIIDMRKRYFPEDKNRAIYKIWDMKAPYPEKIRLSTGNARWLSQEIRELGLQEHTLFQLERFLLNCLHRIVMNPIKNTPEKQDMPDWLEDALTEVAQKEHFSKGHDRFIEIAGRSREHVSRELRKHTGLTPTLLINNLRLEYAAQELLFSGKEIKNIIYEAGFNSLNRFYYLFKQRYKTSPKQFRQKNREPVI